MSAICGFFHRNGKSVLSETAAAMMSELCVFHTDTSGIWQAGPVFFGCHAQHITPESVHEKLPYHDNRAGLTIAADAIIDNRAELFDTLGIDHSRRKDISDSQLILHTYQKWKHNCPRYLIGDFSFAIWDAKQQELFCAVDHTGTRSFYYYCSTRLFAFSTLIRPLFILPEVVKEHNETWIADFLALPTVMHQLDPELTLYKNIYLLPAGHTLTVRPDGVIKQVYWQVTQQPVLKLKTDEEYEEAFREVFGQAVSCRLRSIRPVGTMMSGGIDSTSIACMAATELAKKNQKLQAFSAVPMHGYQNRLPSYWLADETPYIEAVKEYRVNINVNYCRSEDRHSLSDTERLFKMLEQPYKNFENFFWLDGIMDAAQQRNIGIILTGFAGNKTISWVDFPTHLLTLFNSGHLFSLFHESWLIAKCYNLPLSVILVLFTKLLFIQPLHFKKNKLFKMLQDLSPINPDFAHQFSAQERLFRFDHTSVLNNRVDYDSLRLKHLSSAFFSHLGVITTKHGLAYNMALRDPTMDKRVIEFCLSVPQNQFIRNGRDRFLLRRAMSGILPNKVRLNYTIRGKQSADWVQRLQPHWPELAAEIRNIGTLEAECKYLNIAKIDQEVAKIINLNHLSTDDPNLRMLIRSLIFSRFLKYEISERG